MVVCEKLVGECKMVVVVVSELQERRLVFQPFNLGAFYRDASKAARKIVV